MTLRSLGAGLLLMACNHDPAPMKVPTNKDVPLPPATALSAPEPPPAPPSSAQPPSAKRSPCNSDQSCNDDDKISALWGKCTALGTCECSPGFELNPRGRCQKPMH